ncbi:MAG: hypothetical protein MZV63_21485 [Marinilabiliales bacterium]|nr:hypothetical protein [Marinilabiliales bacterium]
MHASKIFYISNADNATVRVAGGSAAAAQSAYNNFWGINRANLHVYTGSMNMQYRYLRVRFRAYDRGNRKQDYLLFRQMLIIRISLLQHQIVCDTVIHSHPVTLTRVLQ